MADDSTDMPTTDSPTAPPPTIDAVAAMLPTVRSQIDFAAEYTRSLLDATPRDVWFDFPTTDADRDDNVDTAGVEHATGHWPSNIAWQVGHLAVAKYGLLLFRLRGRSDEDRELMPSRFRKRYAKGSRPSPDTDSQPSADELYDRLAAIHAAGGRVLDSIDPAALLEEEMMPYAVYPNKLGSLLFCPLHEQVHAGQIGMIRRGLGLEPIR